MSDEATISSYAAKGGKARASVLSADERKQIARGAARARWGDNSDAEQPDNSIVLIPAEQAPVPSHPHSMFRGSLDIGDLKVECHVLSDLRRVLTQREVVRLISGGRVSGNLQPYIDANPLINNNFRAGATIQFKIPGNPTLATGYEAVLLIEICEKYLDARDKKLLKTSQLKLAKQSEIILRACARVGIIALIDEATGFQEFRAKKSLQLKLQAFIAEEMQEWARMFPEEFWFELARMEGIHYSPRSRPLRWGKYVMAFVYDSIDADVGKVLREKNPNPHFMQNHHQWLKDFGRQKVNDHLQRVIAIMKLCDNMVDFKKKFARVFKKSPLQTEFSWGPAS
jgi:P63C domain